MVKQIGAPAEAQVPSIIPSMTNLPDWYDNSASYKGKTGLESLTSDVLRVPRIKLLQGTSKEVQEGLDGAVPGVFWHDAVQRPLGREFSFQLCHQRTRYILMAPMGDKQGILARAEDAIHWDRPNVEFTITNQDRGYTAKWRTAKTVKGSGLDRFGSSNPADPNSPPAAVLTMDYLVRLPGMPEELSPVVMWLSRSQVKVFKSFNMILLKACAGVRPMWLYKCKVKSVAEKNSQGKPFNNYAFALEGIVEKPDFLIGEDINNTFNELKYEAADIETAAAGDDDGSYMAGDYRPREEQGGIRGRVSDEY